MLMLDSPLTTTTTDDPPVLKRRTPLLPAEVTGQCSYCKDLFTVLVYIKTDHLELVETPRLAWHYRPGGEGYVLLHRPDYCKNGKVSLYGSLDRLVCALPASAPRDALRGAISPPARLRHVASARL